MLSWYTSCIDIVSAMAILHQTFVQDLAKGLFSHSRAYVYGHTREVNDEAGPQPRART